MEQTTTIGKSLYEDWETTVIDCLCNWYGTPKGENTAQIDDDWGSLSLEEKVDRLKEIVLPRLAALESPVLVVQDKCRQPVRLPLEMLLQPIRWDGIP